MNNKWFLSSVGDGSLSLTLKGVLAAILPLGLSFLKTHNINITSTDVDTFLQAATGVVSAIMVVYGVVRKIVLAQHTPPVQ